MSDLNTANRFRLEMKAMLHHAEKSLVFFDTLPWNTANLTSQSKLSGSDTALVSIVKVTESPPLSISVPSDSSGRPNTVYPEPAPPLKTTWATSFTSSAYAVWSRVHTHSTSGPHLR